MPKNLKSEKYYTIRKYESNVISNGFRVFLSKSIIISEVKIHSRVNNYNYVFAPQIFSYMGYRSKSNRYTNRHKEYSSH